MEMQFFTDNDQINHRFYDLDNGNKLHLKRTDPYGFIYLNLDKGQLPLAYTSAYTDWSQADIAARKYILERQSVVQEWKDAPFKDKPIIKKK